MPTFAELPDGSFAIHDLRTQYVGNTDTEPLLDGGGSRVLASQPSGTDDLVTFCVNVPMNIFNEEGCVLSTEPNVCSPGLTGSDFAYTTDKTFPPNMENGTVVCGSRGEVAPDPTLDDYFDMTNSILDVQAQTKSPKNTVFAAAVLNTRPDSDQLRQRVAWALSKIVVISATFIGTAITSNEHWLNNYDIYVRNAFGNYRDLIKEMSYSPLMSAMLTYIGSKSTASNWHGAQKLLYPDENYARELFQLFTCGLIRMEMDGTPIVDQYGVPLKTFDTKDIVSFGRAWTGMLRYFLSFCLLLFYLLLFLPFCCGFTLRILVQRSSWKLRRY